MKRRRRRKPTVRWSHEQENQWIVHNMYGSAALNVCPECGREPTDEVVVEEFRFQTGIDLSDPKFRALDAVPTHRLKVN